MELEMVTANNQVLSPALSAGAGAAPGGNLSRVSWGAIFAGAVIALAVMLLLSALGVGIGAATIDPLTDENPISGVPTGSAIYLVIAQLIALGVGGYVAARLAGIPRTMGSVLHGVAVWALASLAMVWLATTAVGGLVSGSTAMLSSAANGAARAAAAVVPDDLQLPDMSMSDISMSDLPPSIQNALRKQGITKENFKSEARQMFRSVISKQEQATARAEAMQTARDIIANPSDAMTEIDQLIDRLFGGPQAVISDEDRQQAMSVMQNRFGITQAEAEQIYNRWVERAQSAAAEVESALATAKTQSLEAASAAASAVSKLGFATFFGLLLGLLAAGGAAMAGRPHDLIGSRANDYV
jgi:hypothetical protein